MRVCDQVRCNGFPCGDVRHDRHAIPGLDVDPAAVTVVLVSEAAAPAATPGSRWRRSTTSAPWACT